MSSECVQPKTWPFTLQPKSSLVHFCPNNKIRQTILEMEILQKQIQKSTIGIFHHSVTLSFYFLRATAGTAIARLSHRNSVRPSICLSVTRVDQAKTVQARIIKSSPSAARKTLSFRICNAFPKIP